MSSSRIINRREFLALAAGGAAGLAVLPGARAQEAAAGQPLFSFGALADIQYCDCDPSGSRYYRNSPEKAAACVEDFNGEDLAFVVQLGDFIDRELVSFDIVLPIYDELGAPHYHVLGNHDFSVAPGEKAQVLGKLGLAKRYYDFAHGGWRFIVLDGNDLSLHGRAEGSEEHAAAKEMLAGVEERGAPNAQTWNGGFSAGQVAWLETTLADASKQGERAILFCHFPVFPENAHNLWNDGEVMALLESHACVAAYINGHNHAGNYGEKSGVHYLTLQGMVETPDTSAYSVIEVHEDQLRVVGHGREPSRTLGLR